MGGYTRGANQLDVCVRSRAEEMGRTGLQID